jgi:hypothetical protein
MPVVYSQCLFWALGEWRSHGGYLVFRRSTHLPLGIPHVLHMDRDGRLRHFIPTTKPRYPLTTVFGFAGHVEEGDENLPDDPPSALGVILGVTLLWLMAVPWAAGRLVRCNVQK